ncbi:hypothetical protein LSH36_154g10057 [Paralvinella palmiformis]|uniref:Uncharacterized protein n=1 Tax=Paralvinella palmiformis TaxID=53620 RepID=A0AAD9N8X2_9ANNE|nr:hypothetical protein LSH36_154g10057 [Paralvinella palmiformis]
MAPEQRHKQAGRSMALLILIFLFNTRGMCDDGLWIVPLDMSTSDPETGSRGQFDSPEPSQVASPTLSYEPDPEYSLDDLECTIENSRVWMDCGPCQCCYKPKETRANCFGNITEIPTDLPENITHL